MWLGRHFDTLGPTEKVEALKYTIASAEPFAVATSTAGRTSLCALLLRILGTAYSKRKAVLWTVIALQIVINTTVINQIYAQCGKHVAAL